MSILTIEDCLELLTGINASDGCLFELHSSDYNILTSIARQVFKGTALTDRQFDLLVKKFNDYKDQFDTNNIDIDFIIENKVLRYPFREVDRTQSIVIDNKHIIAQFPFNKKLINKIQRLRTETTGSATNDKNQWKFTLSEGNVKAIGDTLSNFEMSEDFRNLYDQICEFKYEDYVPGLYNEDGKMSLKNLHPQAQTNLENAIGVLDKSNILMYIDRKRQYGLQHFDVEFEKNTLTNCIALRNQTSVVVQNNIALGEVIDSLDDLSRYPILVMVDIENTDQVYSCYDAVSNKVGNNEQAVMFRLSNATRENAAFNQWIKDNNLNNQATDAKVVYVNASKIPKPIMQKFRPQCILNLSNMSRYGNTNRWITSTTDLILHYGQEPLNKQGLEIIK